MNQIKSINANLFQYTSGAFEKAYGLPWHGPGVYTTLNKTMLVVPVRPEDVSTEENIWNKVQPFGTIYMVSEYNGPYHETILTVLAFAPMRMDLRDLA